MYVCHGKVTEFGSDMTTGGLRVLPRDRQGIINRYSTYEHQVIVRVTFIRTPFEPMPIINPYTLIFVLFPFIVIP